MGSLIHKLFSLRSDSLNICMTAPTEENQFVLKGQDCCSSIFFLSVINHTVMNLEVGSSYDAILWRSEEGRDLYHTSRWAQETIGVVYYLLLNLYYNIFIGCNMLWFVIVYDQIGSCVAQSNKTYQALVAKANTSYRSINKLLVFFSFKGISWQ